MSVLMEAVMAVMALATVQAGDTADLLQYQHGPRAVRSGAWLRTLRRQEVQGCKAWGLLCIGRDG